MNKIVEVLCARDGLSKEEARERLNEVRELVSPDMSYDEIEEIMMDEFGLEMDYILDLLL